MISELKNNLKFIYNETQEKLIPENIKKDVSILGVTGTLDQGAITEEEYNTCLELTGVIINGNTGYTQLSYLITSGEQYIDTLISVTPTTEIEFEYYPLTADWEQWYLQANSEYFVGTRDKNVRTLWWGYNGSNNGGVSLSLTDPLTTVKITNNGQILYNGGVVISGRGTSPTISDTIKISYNTSMRIGKIKIYQDDALIMSLIPAKNNSTNEICMYDEILGKFYYNAGTGVFKYVE